jgi:hypothetical protein
MSANVAIGGVYSKEGTVTLALGPPMRETASKQSAWE